MLKNKTSITSQDEDNRRRDGTGSRIFFNPSKKYGRIKVPHQTIHAATVELIDGGMAYGGEFLPIKNSWQQLIHDFGNLRTGLLVEVIYQGDLESQAEILVIGLESETIGVQQQAPVIDLGLYEIFTPGGGG